MNKWRLITLGTLFNTITRSEFDTCLSPRITPVAYEIGQRCRIERLADLANLRAVNVAEVLLSRNRNRNAAKRAAELAAVLDDEDDWANNFRAHHLGEKLISFFRVPFSTVSRSSNRRRTRKVPAKA